MMWKVTCHRKASPAILGLSLSDQEALLSVVQDYFTSPDEETQDSDWDGSRQNCCMYNTVPKVSLIFCLEVTLQ